MTTSFLILVAGLCVAEGLRGTPAKVTNVTSVSHSFASSSQMATTATYMELGPFEDHAAACKYCYQSHTMGSVVPNCLCTAYTGDSGPTMFCTATAGGLKYAAAKEGACQCTEKNMAKLGATTCDPFA